MGKIAYGVMMRKYYFSQKLHIDKKPWFFLVLVVAIIYYIALSELHPVPVPIQRALALPPPVVVEASYEEEDAFHEVFGEYAVSLSSERDYVALTFDDSPSEHTGDLLRALADMDVKATFFVIGKRVAIHPDSVRSMSEQGHDIGNHTYDHRRLAGGSPANAVKQILECERVIKEITGRGTHFIRPPFNAASQEAVKALGSVGYRFCLYDVDSRDFFDSSRSSILENIRFARAGDVIRLHDGHVSAATLKDVIITLRDMGLEPVALSRMLVVDSQ